jgi:rhodanese-related sulfurtransferase
MKIILSFFLIVLLASCGSNAQTDKDKGYVDVDKTELPALIEAGAILLDVRTPEEIADGKIDGALTINFYDEDFAQQIETISKDATVVVYCKSGGRSSEASKLMSESGWDNVYNLLGGYTDYSK